MVTGSLPRRTSRKQTSPRGAPRLQSTRANPPSNRRVHQQMRNNDAKRREFRTQLMRMEPAFNRFLGRGTDPKWCARQDLNLYDVTH